MIKLKFYVLITSIFLIIFHLGFGVEMQNIGQMQFDQSGDGLKNYYTFSYYLKYPDQLKFNGFLYPNGDLTFYTDSQYSLFLLIKGLSFLGLDFSGSELLILIVTIILGFVLSAIVLFELFIAKGLDYYTALFFSLCGIALSPQLLRVPSHYGLAYPLFFFLVLLILQFGIGYDKIKKIWIFILLVLIQIVAGFIHPYQLLICSFFLVLVGLLYLFKDRIKGLVLLASSVSPVAIYQSIFSIIDHVNDRPKNPYGIWAYQTEIMDLFPGFGLIGECFNHRKVTLYLDEGYCYPTVLVVLVLSIIMVNLITKKAGRQIIKLELTNHEKILGMAGIACLMFAMGTHLDLFGESILEILPPLRQFRALGRFSWPFYYTAFIYSAVLFYRNYIKGKSRFGQLFSLSIIGVLLVLEVFSYHGDIRKMVDKYSRGDVLKNELTIQKILDLEGTSTNFQAMIPIPPSTEGAEKFNLKTDYFIKTRCLPYSFQTGLPMTSSIMSRVSIDQMLRSLEFTNSNYGFKKYKLSDFPNTSPFLLVVNNEYQEVYEDIIGKADFLGSDEHISLYEIELNELLQQKVRELEETSVELARLKEELIRESIFFDDFDDIGYDGVDGLVGSFFNHKGVLTVIDQPMSIMKNTEYELSFWHKILDDKSTVPNFTLSCYKDGNIIYQDEFRDWDMKRVEVYENWVRYNRSLNLPVNSDRLTFSVEGDYVSLDKLLFRPVNSNVHQLINDSLMYMDGYMVLPPNFEHSN